MSNTLRVLDTTFMNADVSMGAHLQVMGDVSFESSLDVSNTLRVLDTTFMNADVSMGAHLQVMGDVSMQSDVQIDGILKADSIEVIGNVTSSGNVFAEKLGIQTTSPQYSIDISATDALRLPVGVSDERPSVVSDGLIRYNTTTQQFEGYSSNAWQGLGRRGYRPRYIHYRRRNQRRRPSTVLHG